MTKEDYCSEEISKLLKESGFNWKCNSYYIGTGGMFFNHFNCHYLADDKHDKVDILTQTLRPTHQMAVKWLREKGIDISITAIYPTVHPTKQYMWEVSTETQFACGKEDSYEKAVEAAILYYLTHTEVYERIKIGEN